MRRIFGIGRSAEKSLLQFGIATIGQIADADLGILRKALGNNAAVVKQLAHGLDDRPVVNDYAAKSIGKECTFEKDLHTEDERRHAVLDLCGRVGWRLRRSGVVGYTVTLKVKFASFKIITRSITAEGPVLLGGAVATFFTGSDFYINKANMTDTIMPVISHWGNGWHGLDALTNIWNVILGLAVFFLARVLGSLYFINNIDDKELTDKCRRAVRNNTVLFLVFFLAFVIRTLVSDGFAVNPDTQEIYMQPYKYLTNFIEMPVVLALFLIGVVLVLFGIGKTLLKKTFDKGIWFTGIGTVLTVLSLLLVAGYNNTAYYPSYTDLQSSLTLANSCSSEFTLKTMAYVSILVPFVLAYIFYAWRSIDRHKITEKEMDEGGHSY